MKLQRSRRRERTTALQRYSSSLGDVAEKRLLNASLVGARLEAEREAAEATSARREIEAVAATLRLEIEVRLGTQNRLAYLASHDPLTSLPNRVLLGERLIEAVQMAAMTGHKVALHYIDLDKFKDVNDTFGHAVGDALLLQVALRIKTELRETDTVARMGGDEFAIIQVAPKHSSCAGSLAKRIINRIREPYDIGGRQMFVGASFGITLYPDDAPDLACGSPDIEVLHRNADLAMYQAKGSGGNRSQFFDDTLSSRARRRTALEQALREPGLLEQLHLVYQPQVNVASGKMVGVEALLRWNHPTYGMISPEEFIPLTEASGMICSIGAWVLRESCTQAAAWRLAGLPDLTMAVNISTSQIREYGIQDVVAAILRETGLPPQLLELEITETGIMRNAQNAAETLNALHQLGVSLSIDDFGTGYSSLSYLRSLPVDRIKIDKSFIADVTTSEDAAVLTNTIVKLAHSLRLQVVAEGVETLQQVEFIATTGCDFVQGYHYSHPLPANEIPHFILRNSFMESAS